MKSKILALPSVRLAVAMYLFMLPVFPQAQE
jgi:hypothetical protein